MPEPTTMERLLDLAALDTASLPAEARARARLSLFDWSVVARAGASQPLSGVIRKLVLVEAGRSEATVVGSAGKRVPARAAALANGTISHALDYDDTHFGHIGHLSVGVLPAALAVAERQDLPAICVIEAFLLGAEAACRIGMVLGRRHYELGFHQTATAGAFGATIAAGRLLGLQRDQLRNALSLVATRASGLKSQFGTMGKPYNAGIAASNGVEAALLASYGFISCDDGIAGSQGFLLTHSDDVCEARGWAELPPDRFVFEDNSYKLHACCHGTHAMLNALRELLGGRTFAPAEIAQIQVRTNPRWLNVCDIKRPRTGLEVKFSYAMLAAMALRGIDTASDRSFADTLCVDRVLLDLAERVTVDGDPALSDTATRVMLTFAGGEQREAMHDLADRMPIAKLQEALQAKAAALLGAAEAERVWSAIAAIDHISAREFASIVLNERSIH